MAFSFDQRERKLSEEEIARRAAIQEEMKRTEEEQEETYQRNLVLFKKLGYRASDQDLH